MWAFILSLILISSVWLIMKYTKLLTKKQGTFLIFSSFMYIILFVIFYSLLLQENGTPNMKESVQHFLSDDKYYFLFFYMAWYFLSASVSNKLLGDKNDIQNQTGFFDSGSIWVSEQNKEPQ
jgi:hypothetical protein